MNARAVALALTLLGCATSAEPIADGTPGEQVLLVQAETLATFAGQRSRAMAVLARGVDARDIAVASAWVGAALSLPTVGTCEAFGSKHARRVREPVDFVAIKAIDVFGQALAPRAYPDLGEQVSGVVYTSAETLNVAAPPLRVRALLSHAEALHIDAEWPALPEHVAVQHRDGATTVAISVPSDGAQTFVDVSFGHENVRCAVESQAMIIPSPHKPTRLAVGRVKTTRSTSTNPPVEVRAVSVMEHPL